MRKASGRTKTEAKTKLRELVRDRDDGLIGNGYTVRDAVEDWLGYGLGHQGSNTIDKYRHLCGKHILPLLGERKLRDLKAAEADRPSAPGLAMQHKQSPSLYGCSTGRFDGQWRVTWSGAASSSW